MKIRRVVLFALCWLCCVCGAIAQQSRLDARLVCSPKTRVIRLVLSNQGQDSITIRTKFFLDAEYGPSRILLYARSDQTTWDYGWFTEPDPPRQVALRIYRSGMVQLGANQSVTIPLERGLHNLEVYADIQLPIKVGQNPWEWYQAKTAPIFIKPNSNSKDSDE